jgi:hypothetical protein
VEHATAVFRALPLLFPSSTLPPKKLGESSEAVFHVLTVRQSISVVSVTHAYHARMAAQLWEREKKSRLFNTVTH